MLRILFFAVIIYLLYRVARRVFGPRETIERGRNGGTIDEMVQDPSCKAYIPKRTALKRNIEGRDYYYCSRECADRHEAETGNRR